MDELEKRTQTYETLCKDCAFNKFDANFGEQIGCTIDRLPKWQALGKAEKTNDEDLEVYYKINTICNYCRPKDYITKYPDPIHQTKKESEVQISFIINVFEHSDAILLRTLNNLVYQSIRPAKIIIMFYRRQADMTPFTTLLDKSSIKSELVNVLVDNSLENLMDTGVKKSIGQYITFCDGGRTIPVNFIEKINNIVNEDLRPLSMINSDFHGLTIGRNIYNTVGGNQGGFIRDKIKELAKSQNLENMIIDYEDLISV